MYWKEVYDSFAGRMAHHAFKVIIDSFKRVILIQDAVIELFITREKVGGGNTQINHILRRNPAITR
jgi:hypothetical protein